MSLKHILKHTTYEIVFKCYISDANGGNIDLSLQNDMTLPSEVYTAPTSIPNESDGHYEIGYTGSRVGITGLWWGLKKDKQLDITRIIDPITPVLHSHYYLIGSNYYDYSQDGAFSDKVYANRDLRLMFDGPGHCIIRLKKQGWTSKIETAEFGPYDNPTIVGS